jgi:4-hydroxythreonine-4-phosphate dehydrogenase
MSDNKIRVGITQGDTNGIGWEVIIKTFADSRMAEMCTPVIYGSPKVATYYKNRLSEVEGFVYNPIQSASQARRGKVNIIDCGPSEIPIEMGKATAAAGAAAVASLTMTEPLTSASGNSPP